MLGIGNNVGARLADRLARPVQSVDRRPPAPRGPAWETSSLSMPKTNTGYTGGDSVTIPKSSTFMPGGVYSNGQRRRGSATPMQQHHGMGSSHNGHAPQSPYGLRPTPMNGVRMWTNAPSKPAPVIMNPVYSAPTIRQSIYSTPNQSFNPYGSAQMPQQTVGTGSMQVPKTAQPQVRRGSQPPLTPSASSRLDSQMPMPKVGRGSQPPMQEGETKPAVANNTRQQPRLVPDQKVDSFHRGDAWSNPSVTAVFLMISLLPC